MWSETRVGPQRYENLESWWEGRGQIVDQILKHVYNYFLCD